MSETELKKLQFENFSLLLKELLSQGHGEIQYRVVVKNNGIEYVSLSKTNTYRPGNDIIEK